MTSDTRLVPQSIGARARTNGRLPVGFGSRFFVALVLGLACLGPAWWSPRLIIAMLLWDVLLLAAWLGDLRRLPAPGQLEFHRVWRGALALAAPARVAIELRNFGRAALRARVVDETPLQLRAAPPLVEMTVAAGGRAQAEYAVLPAERGDVQLGRMFVRYQSGLGLAERWATVSLNQAVRVLPNLGQAKQHTLFLIRSRQIEMEKRRRRQRGLGREFESLREYRQGDEMREICWTATARRNRLVTRIFQIERSQAVWIVLDAGRLLRARVEDPESPVKLSKLDYSVNAALSLAQVAIHTGDRVGLLAYGRKVLQNLNAARGPHQVRAIVEALAQVRGEVGEASHGRAAHALLQAQKRRSLVVWITDFAETATTPEVIESALQMTPRHLVLFAAMGQPDLKALAEKTPETPGEMFRHTAALEIIQRRDLLLRGLRQRGVLALELMPGMLASQLINQYLEIKERSLL